ncbi:ABC transporter permease [Flavobacterium sp.]|uniref:ABC transporter permease n=1 Tax=Flavobacterium sp. TaxID=239 RepID=UPI003527043D
MKDYFNLQFVMTNRKIKETGLDPFLGYLLGLLVFVLLSEYMFSKTAFAKYLLLLACFSLQFKLSEKNRTDFLLATFGNKTKIKIRILENVIVCLPFVLFLLYKSLFFEAGILLLCSVFFASFSFHTNFDLTIPTPFSKKPFEFSTGFRKTFFIFLIAYVLTVVAIKVNNLNLGIFAFLLIFLTSISYYIKPENEYYVWIYSESPNVFLRNKVLKASKNVTLIAIPVLISLLVYYPNEFGLILIFFLIGLLFLWTVIFAKYAAYPREMNLTEGILIALAISFPPLLLIILPFFYKKSITKLKYLLND